ncbi:MAG: hypothetical protein HY835_02630 [Anaerolineae bacterium]|nr:hypothetical protein [Anaerolineae bacterium]
MRTPAGVECPYFYGNYFRGRSEEECRLIGPKAPPGNWTPNLCKNCPVPAIARANACENMVLTAQVRSNLFGLIRRVDVQAYCTLSKTDVKEPQIGCGQCHPLPDEFTLKDQP